MSTVSNFSSFVPGYNNLNVGLVYTKNVTGLSIYTTYYYRVRAAIPCGTSDNFNVTSLTTQFGIAIPGAEGTTIGTGNQNTIDIIAGCAEANRAARYCSDLVLSGYSDWYLPSKDELNQMYINKTVIGSFSGVYYWSSSEYPTTHAWEQAFNTGSQGHYDKGGDFLFARCVRSF